MGMTESEAYNVCFGKPYVVDCDVHAEAKKMIKNALEEVQQYRGIGTVEECREAVGRLKVKRPDGGRDIDGKDYLICPNCCAIVADCEWTAKFCPDCGQALDWSGEE